MKVLRTQEVQVAHDELVRREMTAEEARSLTDALNDGDREAFFSLVDGEIERSA